MVANSDELLEKEKLYVRVFAEKQVDGLVIVPAIGSQGYLKDVLHHVPVVFVDRPPRDFAGPVVKVENEAGAWKLTHHLLEHGFENIAFVSSDLRLPTVAERFKGFQRALEESGKVVRSELVKDGNKTACDAYRAAGELLALSNRPQAIFAANNLMVQGVLRAVKELGLRVPQDIAVVGFDDFEMAEIVQPHLTVVAQPAYDLGRTSAMLLFARIDGKALQEEIVLPVELIVRGSCGCSDRHALGEVKGSEEKLLLC